MTAPWSSGEVLNAGDLNGITNWWWIPSAQFTIALGSPTLGVTGGWSNTAQGYSFNPTGTQAVVTSFYVPQAGNLNFDVYFQGGGSGNFRLTVESGGSKAPGTPGSTFLSLTGYSAPITIPSYNGLAKYVVNNNMAVTAGNLVNIAFLRLGDDAADTSGNQCLFYGIRAYYV